MDNVGKTTFVDKYCEMFPFTFRVKLPTPEVYRLIEMSDKSQWHDIFHENIMSAMRRIREYVNRGHNVICDRYIYSHFVYESMTSKRICEFKENLNPDVIVYFRHSNPKKLPKNDTMEYEVDYEKGQELFEELLLKQGIPFVTVPALRPDSTQIAVTYLKELFNESLYMV